MEFYHPLVKCSDDCPTIAISCHRQVRSTCPALRRFPDRRPFVSFVTFCRKFQGKIPLKSNILIHLNFSIQSVSKYFKGIQSNSKVFTCIIFYFYAPSPIVQRTGACRAAALRRRVAVCKDWPSARTILQNEPIWQNP